MEYNITTACSGGLGEISGDEGSLHTTQKRKSLSAPRSSRSDAMSFFIRQLTRIRFMVAHENTAASLIVQGRARTPKLTVQV
ncbi:hypothetical protein PM082_010656 [Marasmius tenuissimus]|nr:hypothetical protein PM082_010656 [Marasmius tenuissimus]